MEMEMCLEEWSKRVKENLEPWLRRHHREFSVLEKEGKWPKGKAPLEKVSRLDLGSVRKRISGE